MDDAKNQLADKLKSSTNILVTVSRNPSVDQLAACIGLTLLLNKQGKHAAAVFSGNVPSTMEFLQPEDTLEKTTDSLRDFIISLDKSKADKLRYKVEDNVVRIFITPYKTSISEADLEFTQGDFNVDLVVALGVHLQEDLDEAITTHGRILHDATMASINTSPEAGLGTINWQDEQASSLSELVTELAEMGGKGQIDSQIATALLTGIVAETDRFSNEKTSSQTMAASAVLMAAGANQQLVASKLQEGLDISASIQSDTGSYDQAEAETSNPDGLIEINHSESDTAADNSENPPLFELPTPEAPAENTDSLPLPDQPPETGSEQSPQPAADSPSNISSGSRLITEPPSLGGMLTANSQVEGLDPTTDPFSLPASNPPQLLDHDKPDGDDVPAAPPAAPEPPPAPPEPAWTPPSFDPPAPPPASPAPLDLPDASARTLADLEASLGSSHAPASDTAPAPDNTDLNAARDEVSRALNSSDAAPVPAAPIQALNAQPLGIDLHPDPAPAPGMALSTADTANTAPAAIDQPEFQIPPLEISEDGTLTQKPVTISPTEPPPAADPPAPFEPADSAGPQVIDPTAPPPVPPPIPFQFGQSPPPAQDK